MGYGLVLRALAVLAVAALLVAPGVTANHPTILYASGGIVLLDDGPVTASITGFWTNSNYHFCEGPMELEISSGGVRDRFPAEVRFVAQAHLGGGFPVQLEGCIRWNLPPGVLVFSVTNEDLGVELSGWIASAHGFPSLVLQGSYRGHAAAFVIAAS